MAKKSKIDRNLKRQQTVNRYREKRLELRNIIKDPKTSWEEKEEARRKMNAMPRMAIENRVMNRCGITGRPRGYLRKFNMSRIAFRELANNGLIPGVTKSSW